MREDEEREMRKMRMKERDEEMVDNINVAIRLLTTG